MLRQLMCLLVLGSAVNALPFAQEKETIICEQKLSGKCSKTIGRFGRSIENPISGFFKNINENNDDNTLIKCEQGLVIKVVRSEVSNVDKTKCSANQNEGKSDDCTDKLLTTIFLTKKCQGKSECSVSMSKDLSNFCPCSSQKYLNLKYTCVRPEDSAEEIKSINKRYIRLNYNMKRRGEGNRGEGYRGEGLSGGEGYRGEGYRGEGYRGEGYRRTTTTTSTVAPVRLGDLTRGGGRISSRGGEGINSRGGEGINTRGGEGINTRGGEGINTRNGGAFYDDYYGDYYYDDYYGDYYGDYYYY